MQRYCSSRPLRYSCLAAREAVSFTTREQVKKEVTQELHTAPRSQKGLDLISGHSLHFVHYTMSIISSHLHVI